MRLWLAVAAALAASAVVACLAGAARPATTTFDPSGTIRFDGRPTLPIVLSPGPPLGSATPWGTDGLAETASAGVNMYRVGPGTSWSTTDIDSALAWDRAAAAVHAYTWLNLNGYGLAQPGSTADGGLARAVGALNADPSSSAIGMWRGRDEPWWGGIAPSALQFPFCRVTGRGDPSWCAGEAPLDPGHLWVTIEAPRGTAADLAPYSGVTDVHGVDDYPVTLKAGDSPDLHQVGTWTATLASVTPNAPVWTTLQICSSGANDKTTGAYVLPTYRQERYMAYDAILNGAHALNFFGGSVAGCLTPRDAQYGWNWTFWQRALKPLVRQLAAASPLGPALVNDAPTPEVTADDRTTETLVKQGPSASNLWLIAARSGSGYANVTFTGLPAWARQGTVYTEGRSVTASGGSFRDVIGQWGVHVYHFVKPAPAS
jgi:hypothetical protein